MNGNFYKHLYSIHGDIELLEVIIDNFLSFEDERKYDEKRFIPSIHQKNCTV